MYITDYHLKLDQEIPINFKKVFTEITGHDYYDGYLGKMKWYTFNEDMLKVSKYFTTILFTLEGTGEDSCDNWLSYYKNGKSYSAEIVTTIEAFNPTKLK